MFRTASEWMRYVLLFVPDPMGIASSLPQSIMALTVEVEHFSSFATSLTVSHIALDQISRLRILRCEEISQSPLAPCTGKKTLK